MKTGNPTYRRPSVLVVYRDDHKFMLDSVIPKPGQPPEAYDFVLASQPWRARMSADFKAGKVLAPLARSLLRAHGGDVWFESRPGRGTTFTATLPVAAGAGLPGNSDRGCGRL